MSDLVEVPFDDHTTDNAVLLLAAAEDLDLPASVVKTTDMGFLAPQEVVDKAFPPAKATKKAPAKKAPAKKTTTTKGD